MKYAHIYKNSKYLGGGYKLIASVNTGIADGLYVEQFYPNLRAAKSAAKKQNLILWNC
jgi:hypothetical protein